MKTVQKLGSDLEEGDVIVGQSRQYLVISVCDVVALKYHSCTWGCKGDCERRLDCPLDIYYTIKLRPRTRRARIQAGLETYADQPEWICNMLDAIEKELDADA